MVEKAKTKHSGFFINRGALEKMFVFFSLLPWFSFDLSFKKITS